MSPTIPNHLRHVSLPAGLTLTALALTALALTGCPKPGSGPASPKHPASTRPASSTEASHGGDPWTHAKLITPPKPAPAVALKLPPIKRSRLRNGLSTLILRDTHLPLITVRLTLPVGAIDDPADRVGLADFTGQMLRQGVAGLTAERLAARVDAVGANLSVSPGYEISTITCSAQARDLDLCLELVSSLATKPTFPQKEMAQVARQLEGMVRSDRDDPGMLAAKHFYNQLYGDDHPAGRPLTLASIAAITRKDLLRFYKTHYRPTDAVLAISGAIDEKTLSHKLARTFGRWAKGKRPARHITPVAPAPRGLRVLLVDKPDLTQSFFALGHEGVTFRNNDRDALRVANYVLGGGGFSSRLMKVVRSLGGKTYGINSAFYAQEFDGIFRVRSSTRNPEIVRTLALVQKELARIRDAPPTAQEIAEAKGKIAGGFAIRFKTVSQVAAALALAQVRRLGDTYVSELPLRVDGLTAAQVAAAAKTYVHPDRLVAAIVGRGDVVAPLLDAAKIPYERISYLAPISARARREAKRAVKISPKEAKAGRALLARALRAAGGKRALAKIKAARLRGKMTRKTPQGPMVSTYEVLMRPPAHLRFTFTLAGAAGKKGPPMKMEQILAGAKAFMLINGAMKRPLPPRQRQALRRSLWRHPVFVLQNAAMKGTRLRPSHDPAIDKKTQVGLDVFPAKGRPLTLVFDKRTTRLAGFRERGPSGDLRTGSFDNLRRDKRLGVWIPTRVTAQKGALVLEITKVELNPKITKSSFVAP